MKRAMSRLYAASSLVRVYRLSSDGTKIFQGYQNSSGEWVDENGVPLGEVKFAEVNGQCLIKGSYGRD